VGRPALDLTGSLGMARRFDDDAAEEDEVTTPLSTEVKESSVADGVVQWRSRIHKAALLGVGVSVLLLGAIALTYTSRAPPLAVATIPESMATRQEGDSEKGLVQLFGDMAHGKIGPDGRPVPQREEIRKLIEQAFEWEDEPEAALQCSIDVVQAVAYLGQAVVFLYKAAEFCPDNDETACGVSVSIVLTSFAWIASYLSLAAESCKEALQAHYISLGAICAADITGLAANMLEIISVSQAVEVDCDFGPGGPWEQWQHNGSAVADLWHSMKRDDTSVGKVLTREYKKLGLVKGGAWKKWMNSVGPLGFHSMVYPLAALRKQFHTRKGHAWWPGWPGASPAKGRRLGKKPDGVVSDFLEKAKTARDEKLEREQEQMARNYDIAQCVFDVTQSVSYIVRATFQIHSALENCPDPTSCSVDILNIISSFAWITQFTALAVGDCAVESYQRAYCTGDISDMVAAVTNGAAIGTAVSTDCAPE